MKSILLIISAILFIGCNDLTASTADTTQVVGLECNRKVLSVSVATHVAVLSRPMKSDDTEETLWIDVHYSNGINRYTIRESRCK